MIDRGWISQQFVKGVGVEIGAFHNPWPYDHHRASLHYVDKSEARETLARHPDMARDTHCVETHWLDDGEFLKLSPDKSYDFVIASHVLEHCFSPLTAIENHLRVVKPGGYVIYALPDKRHTFDKTRPNSRRDCVWNDYKTLPRDRHERMVNHHHEYLECVDKIFSFEKRVEIATDRISNGMDIHYHAWNSQGIYDLFTFPLAYNFETVLFYPFNHEVFIVLRRTL